MGGSKELGEGGRAVARMPRRRVSEEALRRCAGDCKVSGAVVRVRWGGDLVIGPPSAVFLKLPRAGSSASRGGTVDEPMATTVAVQR